MYRCQASIAEEDRSTCAVAHLDSSRSQRAGSATPGLILQFFCDTLYRLPPERHTLSGGKSGRRVGIGRRGRLKICWRQRRVGSSPTAGISGTFERVRESPKTQYLCGFAGSLLFGRIHEIVEVLPPFSEIEICAYIEGMELWKVQRAARQM